jgi:hypothetical protein
MFAWVPPEKAAREGKLDLIGQNSADAAEYGP